MFPLKLQGTARESANQLHIARKQVGVVKLQTEEQDRETKGLFKLRTRQAEGTNTALGSWTGLGTLDRA